MGPTRRAVRPQRSTPPGFSPPGCAGEELLRSVQSTSARAYVQLWGIHIERHGTRGGTQEQTLRLCMGNYRRGVYVGDPRAALFCADVVLVIHRTSHWRIIGGFVLPADFDDPRLRLCVPVRVSILIHDRYTRIPTYTRRQIIHTVEYWTHVIKMIRRVVCLIRIPVNSGRTLSNRAAFVSCIPIRYSIFLEWTFAPA